MTITVTTPTTIIVQDSAARGAMGPTGPQGPAGPAGPQGIAGAAGDRYRTNSNSTVQISGGYKTFQVESNLAYTFGQHVTAANSESHYIHGPVSQYYPSNGTLIVFASEWYFPAPDPDTYSRWEINLAGIPGPDGANGASANVQVGNVVTGAEGSNVTITNVGNSTNVILDFSIPRGNTGVNSNINLLSVNTDIIPSANVTYNIGSQDYQWNDLWVSNNTIFIGGVALSVANGQLTFDGNPVGSGGAAGLPLANGTSNIDIITANGNVTISTDGSYTWNFDTNGILNLAGDLQFPYGPEIRDVNGDLRLRAASGNVTQLQGLDGSGFVDSAVKVFYNSGGYVTINTNIDGSPEHIWTFGPNGDLTVPNYINFAGNTYIGDEPGAGTPVFRIVAPLGYGATIETDSDIEGNNYVWAFGEDGTLTFPDSTVQTTAYTGGGASLPLANGTSNIDIALANGYVTVTANTYTWTFNETNGLLELAGNLANFSACSAINFVANSSGDGAGYSTIELRPDSNATLDQYLIIDPTAPNHIHIRAGGAQDNSNAEIYLGGENSYFKVDNGENPSVSISANTFTWTFDPTDGFISFPNGSTQNTAFNANPVLDYTTTDNLQINSGVEEKYVTIANANGTVVHDCANGHIFYHTTPTANWTANFTNLILTNGYATTLTLVINQGATPYYANSVLIDSSVTTINWQGNTAPTPTANRKDVVSFSILKTGENSGNVIILGQLTGF